MSTLQGGKFGHGFASAGFAQANSGWIGKLSDARFSAKRIIAAAAVGGTASRLSGGKFANGAVTGAFSRAFNDEVHAQRQNDRFEKAVKVLVDKGLIPKDIANNRKLLVDKTNMAALKPADISETDLRLSDLKLVGSWSKAQELIATGNWQGVEGSYSVGVMRIYMGATKPGGSKWLSRTRMPASLSGSQNLIETIHHEYLHYSGVTSHTVSDIPWGIRVRNDLGGWIHEH